jgi:hypothetical protein
VLLPCFELRLHQDYDQAAAAVIREGRVKYGWKDEGCRDERNVHGGKVKELTEDLASEVTSVALFQQTDPRVLAKLEIHLAVSSIDCNNLRSAMLKQAVGESSSRGADIETRLAGYVDLPVFEGALEFESAAADVSQIVSEETDRGVGRDLGSGLLQFLIVDQDLSCKDQSLRALTRRDEAAVYEEFVEAGFQKQ